MDWKPVFNSLSSRELLVPRKASAYKIQGNAPISRMAAVFMALFTSKAGVLSVNRNADNLCVLAPNSE